MTRKVEVVVSWSARLNIERLNQGRPLIAANPDGWDDGFTLNPTAVRLERSPHNDKLIQELLDRHTLDDPKLNDGVVAVFYRGVPDNVPDRPRLRSSVGVAVFTPNFELLERLSHPVIVPTEDPAGYDYNGVEDQRITRIDDTFYMVYCGFNPRYPGRHGIHICMARSADLVNWEKLGPIRGSVNDSPNKDAVIMPEPINGMYMMLHRPMVGSQSEYSIALAVSDSPDGEWRNLGTIMRAQPDPRYHFSWLGAGSAPLPLGGNRFLMDYHVGNYYANGDRDYYAGCAILNFNDFDVDNPEGVVEARCDCLITPETPYEQNSPWPHPGNLNCVFPAGTCEYGDDVIVLYGGADAYVLGARFKKSELVAYIEKSGIESGLRTLSNGSGKTLRVIRQMSGRLRRRRREVNLDL